MSQIKFEVVIDATNTQHLYAAISFLQQLGGKQIQGETLEVKEEKPKKKAAPKKQTPKPKQEPAPVEEKKQSAQPNIKIEDVRALLAQKVGDNRAAIKSKLTELEANNVTSLDKSKYQEFMDFLNSL